MEETFLEIYIVLRYIAHKERFIYMTTAIKRLAAYGRALPVRWTTVAVFALAIAYVDGFWVTALQGAIGAVELNEPPFILWLRDATLMLPLVFLAVLLALLGARRWFARSRHRLIGLAVAALLVALISGGVGIAEVGASSLRNYQLQVHHLEQLHSYGAANQPGSAALAEFGSVAPLPYYLYCRVRGAVTVAADGSAVVGSAVTLLEYATLLVHVRALSLSALVLLITNLVIAVGLLALLNDRLWSTQLAADPQANETTSQLQAAYQ